MRGLKAQKKNFKGMTLFLILFTFFIILFVMVMTTAAKNASKKSNVNTLEQSSENTTSEENDSVLTVLKEIDAAAGTMTLLNTENGQDMIFNFNGGTNITDKYEQVISANQLSLGEMLDAYYETGTSDLTKLQISNHAWEYKGVSKWSLDDANKILTIADTKYKLKDDLVIVGQDKFLSLSDLDEKDELIVKGYDKNIWSIIVSIGHGTLRLEDYADFIGGTAYIGNKEILPIVEDMTVTVQEGTYLVSLEKGNLKGSKTATVKPLEETILNMSEFKKPPVKTGFVKFHIKPKGADLYIDNDLKEYDKALELEYGEHSIKVSLGGYTTFSGTLDLEESSKTITIDLAETQSGDNTGKTQETDNNTTENNNSGNNNNTNGNNTTDSNNSTTDKNSSDTETGGYQETNGKNNIYVEEPKDASVYFDGVFKGSVPVSFTKQSGTHYITLIQSGHKTKTYTVEIEDDGKDVKYSFDDLAASE